MKKKEKMNSICYFAAIAFVALSLNAYPEIFTDFKQNDTSFLALTARFMSIPVVDGIRVDGDGSEWKDAAVLHLPSAPEQITHYEQGQAAITADFYYAHNDKAFCFYVEVADPTHVFIAGNNFWQGDSVQFAICRPGMSSYGDEVGIYYDDKTDKTHLVHSLNAYNASLIQCKAWREEGKTCYEIALPWLVFFPQRIPEFLFSLLINNNDGRGRAGCIEIAPRGISNQKNNSQFPMWQLRKRGESLYLYSRVVPGTDDKEDDCMEIFCCNDGPKEEVTIDIPLLKYKEKIRIRKGHGVGRLIPIPELPVGMHKAVMNLSTPSGRTAIRSEIVEVRLSRAQVAAYYRETEPKIAAALKALDKEITAAKARGVIVDYAQSYREIVAVYLALARSDVKAGIYEYVPTVFPELLDIIDEAHQELKNSRGAVPRYRTSDVNYLDKWSWYATMEKEGKRVVSPAFFIGFMGWEPAVRDIPLFAKMGFNAIQTETSPETVLRAAIPQVVPGWQVFKILNAEGSVSISQEQAHSGKSSLKVVNTTPKWRMNQLFSVYQCIPAKPNTVYEWGVNAKADHVINSWIGVNDRKIRQRVNGTYDWRLFSGELTTDADQTELDIELVSEDKGIAIYCDDFYLREKGTTVNLLANPGFEESDATNAKQYTDYMPTARYLKSVDRLMKSAAKNDVAVDLLLSMHIFPSFLRDKYPDMAFNGGGFLKYIIDHPKAKQALQDYLDTLLPRLKKYNALRSICLTNEPAFFTNAAGDFYLPAWRDFLRKSYKNDISQLNRAWKRSYKTFDEITFDDRVEYSASDYDYKHFNDKVFAEWHAWLGKIVRKHLPDMKIHVKVSADMANEEGVRDRQQFVIGNNLELYAEFSDINGNDFSVDYNAERRTIERQMALYDLQTSIKAAPVFNSEDHLLADNVLINGKGQISFEQRQINRKAWANFIETNMWMGAIHGRGASTLFFWDTRYDFAKRHRLQQEIYTVFPKYVQGAATALMDLNRLSKEVTAMQWKKCDIALLYSITARCWSRPYMASYYESYRGGLFNGQKVASIVDTAPEKLREYDFVIVPASPAYPKRMFEEVIALLDRGGTAIVIGNGTMLHNEHGVLFDKELLDKLKKNALWIDPMFDEYRMPEESSAQLRQFLGSVLTKLGKKNIEALDATTGKPMDKVEWCSLPAEDGDWLISVCNLEQGVTKNISWRIEGKNVKNGVELRSGNAFGTQITLNEYDSVLLRISKNAIK